MRLRKELCSEILKDISLPAKLTVILDGFKVKAKIDTTYKLDEAVINQIFEKLSDEEKGALKFRPELNLKMYKKLSDSSLLHAAVTTKPASPTLEIISEPV